MNITAVDCVLASRRYYTGIGSRETPENIQALMTAIAIALHDWGWYLRSGAAKGADQAFELGSKTRKEIWLPWPHFNNHDSLLFPHPRAFVLAQEHHPAWDKCSIGARALHARNVHQVLGKDLNTHSSFIICWTKDGQASGGTGQAIRIATHYNIPVFNLYWPKVQDRIYKVLKELSSAT